MTITKEEAFQQYEEELERLSREFNEAKTKAKATLNANLEAIRSSLHEELRAIRNIQQRKGR